MGVICKVLRYNNHEAFYSSLGVCGSFCYGKSCWCGGTRRRTCWWTSWRTWWWTCRRIFLMVTLPDSSLAELSPPLPPFPSEWRPPLDQTDSSPPVRSSLTDSLKDLTSTSSPPNKSPPTIQLPSAIHVFYLLCKLIHKIFIATFKK